MLPACDKLAEKAQEEEISANEVAAQLAQVKIDPGQWESVTEIVSVTGPLPKETLQKMVGQRNTVSNCITPEQAARPSANFLAAQQNSDCTYQEFTMRDGRLTGRMTCSGGNLPGKMVTAMSGAYGPQGYDMMMDMQTAGVPGAAALKIKTRAKGKRLGECA